LIFYLPWALELYGDTFARAVEDEKVLKGHTTYKWPGGAVVRLCGDEKKGLSPEKFIEIRNHFGKNEMTIVDRYRGDSAVVQIIDHRNLSGTNPLVGKTPIGNRPQFPDVSKLYSGEERELQQVVVDCLGKEKFQLQKERTGVSEMAAHIALCAFYAGWKITAFGWCQELDKKGSELGKVLKNVF
tara:strand:+ start:243 stop:797 length:555 start_codon:yes stop_codon:yes gene_type:complete